jgi:hypothetical protein
MGKLFEPIEFAAARYEKNVGKKISFTPENEGVLEDALLQAVVAEAKVYVLQWLTDLKYRENSDFAALPSELTNELSVVSVDQRKNVLDIFQVAVDSFSQSTSSGKHKKEPFAIKSTHPKDVVNKLKIENISPAMQILKNFLKKELEAFPKEVKK